MKSLFRKLIYLLLYLVAFLLFKTFFFFKVYGKENELNGGGIIFVANHNSWFDFLIMAISLKPNKFIHFLAKEEVFKGFLKYFLNFMEIIPVKRDKLDRNVIKLGMYYLTKNENLGIFPEATRSPDGKFQVDNFHSGANFFSLKNKSPIQMILIKGSFKAFPRGSKFPKLFTSIRSKIYPPIYPDKYINREFNVETLNEYTDELKNLFIERLKEDF
ncbi:MAG: 1-acyl-sn-glycerol-3-phosphate acyltransferase [Caldisericia bacterium]|nr:1-acyl-sn-glycerol-3-phosphate acyltransferase [Caldisericia bacterium]